MAKTAKSSNKEGLLEKFVPVLLVLTIALAFFVGILWNKVSTMENGGLNTGAGAPSAEVSGKLSEEMAKKVPAASENDHIRGSLDAEVFLIEYSDLECPYCAAFHPTALQAIDEYGDKIAWVYRHFPLETIHPRALPGANAAECVASLGGNDAFWKFTDSVFADQEGKLTDAGLKEAASMAGVDPANFAQCYSNDDFEDEVRADITSGEGAGVTGTPGNFVMNKKGDVWVLGGAVPFSSLKSTIDEALQ